MITVPVNKDILFWAMERSGLTIEELQSRFSKIRQWVSGQRQPTLRQLEALAKATATPLGYFFLDEPPEERLPIPYFRTFDENQAHPFSADLLDSVHAMQQRQFWLREYLIEQGQEKLPFVRSADLREHPVAIAERIRETLGLDDAWASSFSTWTEALKVLRETMENTGFIVVVNGIVGNNTHRKLDPGEFRGFVLVDEYAPLVFVNGADSKAAQMFTLAHEIVHVWFGSSAAFDLRQMTPASDPVEQACNQIAAELLVPEHQIRQIWSSVKSEAEPFQVLARRFKVSALVAARRALDLRLINKPNFLTFYHSYLRNERRTATNQAGGGDFYANQNFRVGHKFAVSVFRAVKEGKLLYSDAYKLTGLHGKTFSSYAAHLGIGGM